MAIGGFLGGLANLGAVAGGAQQYQLQDAHIRQALAQLAAEQRRQQLFDLQMKAAQQEQQALTAEGQALGNLFGQPQQGGGSGMPDYSPGAAQAQPLPPPGYLPSTQAVDGGTSMRLPQVPSYGSSGGMPTNAQLNLARQAIARGYPPAAAAGIAGSLTGESGRNLDPYALSPSGALGQAQWLGPRKAALLQQPNPGARETQDRFLFNELRGPEAASGRQMMAETDPGKAAADFTRSFERPGNVDLAPRAQAARAIYQEITRGAAQQIQSGVPQSAARDSAQTSLDAASNIDPTQWGRSALRDVVAAVDKSNPGLDPAVKMLAVGNLMKLMAPEDRMAFQMFMQQNRQELQLAIKEMQIQAASDRANLAQGSIAGVYQQGGQSYGVTRGGDVKLLALPEGATKAGGAAGGPVGIALQRYLQENPGASAADIQKFVQGTRGSARSGQAAATQRFLQEHPGATDEDIADFVAKLGAQISGTKAFLGAGKQGDMARFLGVALSHMDVLDEAGKALNNRDTQSLNRLTNYFKTQFGYEGPVDFNAVKQVAVTEVVKATSGGVLTGEERQKLQDSISAASSPEQLQGVLREFRALMTGQLEGLRRQFLAIPGSKAEDFEKALSPEVKERLGGGGGQARGESHPVPPENANDPDGTTYNNGAYVKRGNVIVPAAQ